MARGLRCSSSQLIRHDQQDSARWSEDDVPSSPPIGKTGLSEYLALFLSNMSIAIFAEFIIIKGRPRTVTDEISPGHRFSTSSNPQSGWSLPTISFAPFC